MNFLRWFQAHADELVQASSDMTQNQSSNQTPVQPRRKRIDPLTAAMVSAKNERKKSEMDVQLLANRLAHLRYTIASMMTLMLFHLVLHIGRKRRKLESELKKPRSELMKCPD